MKSRWYLAAFPVALLACDSEQGVPVYGAPFGGGSTAQSGGYANLGTGQTAATGGIDTGIPTGNTGGAISVRYGPVSSVGAGGTGR